MHRLACLCLAAPPIGRELRDRADALGAASAWAETKVQLVEVITSPQRTEFLKSQLAEFEKANPDIKVDVVSLPWGVICDPP